MAEVVFDHVDKRFGSVIAVSDLCLKVNEGEFLVLVGPSGCGKTTALRMIAGLETATAGNLYINDRRVNDVAPRDRDIAMVFQNYALYPHMNVYDNMAFGLKMRHVPSSEIDRLIRDAADILDIGELLKRKPKELSGGQRQRVALGRAIVRQPQAFLMDEPLSNLDAKLRVQTRAELIKLHQRLHTTTVYVTHDQTEAMTMGNRIAVMKDGVLQQLDTPQSLYDNPVNQFVAGFIGSPSMSFFDARLESVDGKAAIRIGDSVFQLPPEKAKILGNRPAGDLIFGIRPENLSVPNENSEAVAEALVEVVEPLGSDVFVTYRLADTSFVARQPPHHMTHIGNVEKVAFDLRAAHFFDKETRQTLA